jgi:peptidoglycan LD-endopeptidase CwlK
MTFILGPRSLSKLKGVHPDLVSVVQQALVLSPIDFAVTEGVRTLARQKELVAAGASKTMKSRHLTGHAVDLAPIVSGKVRWDWPAFDQLIPAVKQAALDCGVECEFGYDWVTFKDGPHVQLSWSAYP